jgi:hypothetical protein
VVILYEISWSWKENAIDSVHTTVNFQVFLQQHLVVQCFSWCYNIVLGCVTKWRSFPWMIKARDKGHSISQPKFPHMHFSPGQSAEFKICCPNRTSCYWFINQLFNSAFVVTIYYKYIALPVKFIFDGRYFSVCLNFNSKMLSWKAKFDKQKL